MFEAAAQTRKEEIESQKGFNPEKDKVVILGVSDISKVKDYTEWAVNTYSEQYGQTAEIGIWSHAGQDGPVGTEPASASPLYEGSTQMSLDGWGNINYNWKENGANLVFYGCNTGRDVINGEWSSSFARNVSENRNVNGVSVWGQSTSAFPSNNPYYRSSSLTRSTGIYFGPTYMVGGNRGEGGKSMWFNPFSSYPPANPMNVYHRGSLVRSTFQNR